MSVIVRFPPSPTGFLHIGNARVALTNFLFAKKFDGKIILRFDDTDKTRCTDELKEQMIKDLSWLGIEFDEKFEQSKRTNLYTEVLQKLEHSGHIYKCYETEEELEIKRKMSTAMGKAPIYDRSSLNFTPEQKIGRQIYYRFKLPDEIICWQDTIQGKIEYDTKNLSDPVVLRANGDFMYTFCSIVDDYLMKISHIIRGADHITNTAIQISILNAINQVFKTNKSIIFAHLPLFSSKEGKISKRVGGYSIIELKKAGYSQIAIKNALASIGLSYFDNSIKTEDELISKFDLSSFGTSQITFDTQLISDFNSKFISSANFEDVLPFLPTQISPDLFYLVRETCENFEDFSSWHETLGKESNINLLEKAEQDFVKECLKFKSDNWSNWLEKQKKFFNQFVNI